MSIKFLLLLEYLVLLLFLLLLKTYRRAKKHYVLSMHVLMAVVLGMVFVSSSNMAISYTHCLIKDKRTHSEWWDQCT